MGLTSINVGLVPGTDMVVVLVVVVCGLSCCLAPVGFVIVAAADSTNFIDLMGRTIVFPISFWCRYLQAAVLLEKHSVGGGSAGG